ncbi:MAG: cell division protein ZapA [Gammaproteobacteria bacterium]|nr:cell division protein ZapA [Gammaproteobacteria bacterium]
MSSETVTLHILGKAYHVTSPADEVESLKATAEELDRRMHEVRDGSRVLDNERVAVMVALNALHESRSLEQNVGDANGLREQLDALAERVAASVAEHFPADS